MKWLMMITMSLLTFSLTGCTPKIVYKDKLVCTEQMTVERPKIALRVHKADVELAKEFAETNNQAFEFYESQVTRNNELCKEGSDDKPSK